MKWKECEDQALAEAYEVTINTPPTGEPKAAAHIPKSSDGTQGKYNPKIDRLFRHIHDIFTSKIDAYKLVHNISSKELPGRTTTSLHSHWKNKISKSMRILAVAYNTVHSAHRLSRQTLEAQNGENGENVPANLTEDMAYSLAVDEFWKTKGVSNLQPVSINIFRTLYKVPKFRKCGTPSARKGAKGTSEIVIDDNNVSSSTSPMPTLRLKPKKVEPKEILMNREINKLSETIEMPIHEICGLLVKKLVDEEKEKLKIIALQKQQQSKKSRKRKDRQALKEKKYTKFTRYDEVMKSVMQSDSFEFLSEDDKAKCKEKHSKLLMEWMSVDANESDSDEEEDDTTTPLSSAEALFEEATATAGGPSATSDDTTAPAAETTTEGETPAEDDVPVPEPTAEEIAKKKQEDAKKEQMRYKQVRSMALELYETFYPPSDTSGKENKKIAN